MEREVAGERQPRPEPFQPAPLKDLKGHRLAEAAGGRGKGGRGGRRGVEEEGWKKRKKKGVKTEEQVKKGKEGIKGMSDKREDGG